MPSPKRSPSIVAAVLLLAIRNEFCSAAVTPTCKELESFYFPNECVTECTNKGSTMDLDRSRNVNGNQECYCQGELIPYCTDDPSCADLGIVAGTASESCRDVCRNDGGNDQSATVTDGVEYASDPQAANKNQTHFVVECSCDGGKTAKCGKDYILFSDLTYLQSCTGDGLNSKNINSELECNNYCTAVNPENFIEGLWLLYESNPPQFSCACVDVNFGDRAVACDDANANYNDGSGLGNDCYDTVGVNAIDCPTPSAGVDVSQQSTKKAIFSIMAITAGAWLFLC